MYKIDTGQARTDLFGIGKGEAQVINFDILQEKNRLAAQEEARKQAADEKRKSDLFDNLAGLDAKGVKPNDVQYFAQKQQDLVNNVKKKIDANGNMSVQDRLDFENAITQLKAEGLASQNARNVAQANLKMAAAAPEGTYDPEDIQKHMDFLSDSKYTGNYDTGDLALNKNFDYNQYVDKVLLPAAQAQAKNTSNQGYEKYTLSQAEKDIDLSLQDPIKARAVSKQMQKDKDAGLIPQDMNDIHQYAKKTYAPKLLVNVIPRPAEWQVYGSGRAEEKKPPVTVTHNPEGKSDVAFTSKPNESYEIEGAGGKKITVSSPKSHYENGVLTGGTAVDLTLQKQNDVKTGLYTKKVYDINQALTSLETEQRDLLSLAETKEEKDKIINESAGKIADLQSQLVREKKIYEKSLHNVNIKLTPQQVVEATVKATGAKPEDILHNKAPQVNRQEFDNRGNKTSAQWTYNGHTASEEEWLKNGWTVEKLQKHAKKK